MDTLSLPLKKILQYILGVLSLCVVAMAVYNTAKVGAFFHTYSRPYPQISQTDRFIKLTKTGKNVIVIMVDGATGYMAQHAFENRPALYEDFDGFTLTQ